MKKIMLVLGLMVLGFATMAVGKDKAPKVKELEDGFFSQHFYPLTGSYVVDTQAHLCLVVKESIAEIPCEKLARRPEWKPIITWVK
ncbi:MAG: hypothetical protein Q7S68_02515 [Deltaproteobacteria bacterium]|nr:hypothetical protein [Deltaproteobacteria bacterium]